MQEKHDSGSKDAVMGVQVPLGQGVHVPLPAKGLKIPRAHGSQEDPDKNQDHTTCRETARQMEENVMNTAPELPDCASHVEGSVC
jgi:hypothetical protein